MYPKLLLIAACCIFATTTMDAQRLVNQKPVPAKVKVNRLGNNINTPASDFAPARYGNRIYFTSMYKKPIDGKMVTRIYSFMQGGKAQLVPDMNMKRKSAHIAHVAFMPDASRMYFSICRDDAQGKCQLWYRDKNFDGSWGAAKKMPEYINVRGATTTQPSIGWDEEQKKFALFFVSDRAGGKGGKDIWVSHISWNGHFETPYPLPVNTEKDDITPYFDRTEQVLYFSSNGRKGEGRFDIFKSEKKGDMWSRPTNLGRPYNSAYDDIYYMIHAPSGVAYLTSDRPGSLCNGKDVEGCKCYDIYEVVKNEIPAQFNDNERKMDNLVLNSVDN